MGTQSPVRRKAARIPIAASTPNDLSAAISENRFAENAAMVVIDVRRIALPTRLSVIVPDSVGDFPFRRSSL